MIAGAAVYLLASRFNAARTKLLAVAVVTVPIMDGAVNGAAGYPTWVALNSAVPTWIAWIARALTVSLALLLMWGAIRAVNQLDPSDSDVLGVRRSAPSVN
jgi:hypothetical protein